MTNKTIEKKTEANLYDYVLNMFAQGKIEGFNFERPALDGDYCYAICENHCAIRIPLEMTNLAYRQISPFPPCKGAFDNAKTQKTKDVPVHRLISELANKKFFLSKTDCVSCDGTGEGTNKEHWDDSCNDCNGSGNGNATVFDLRTRATGSPVYLFGTDFSAEYINMVFMAASVLNARTLKFHIGKDDWEPSIIKIGRYAEVLLPPFHRLK